MLERKGIRFNYENAQELGVFNFACQQEISELTDIAISTKTLRDVEKLENAQVSIQEKSLSHDEEALHIIS